MSSNYNKQEYREPNLKNNLIDNKQEEQVINTDNKTSDEEETESSSSEESAYKELVAIPSNKPSDNSQEVNPTVEPTGEEDILSELLMNST